MNRTVAALLAALAVLALGAAAATLEDTTAAGGSGGAGDDSGLGAGRGDRLDLGGFNASETTEGPTVPPVVGRVLAAVVLLVGLLGLYSFYREHGLKGFATVVSAVAVLFLLLYLLVEGLGGLVRLGGLSGLLSGRVPTLPGGSPAGPESSAVPVTDPPAVLFALFGLVFLGAVALALRMTGDDVAEAAPEAGATSTPDVAAVGRAAGRAADRIEEWTAVENAVFGAWREMTRHLDVSNPAASTPAEFAAAAVDAGMAREDVDELTDLFEEVRYGGAEPDADRERRAVAALRGIERTYADADIEVPDRTDAEGDPDSGTEPGLGAGGERT